MRTLALHTADELAVRWKRWAEHLSAEIADSDRFVANMGDYERGYKEGRAQAYRVAAAELQALTAVSMELEAAHHGDPEPDSELAARAFGVPPRNDVAEGNVWPREGDES
jgi:hypothetical protein